MRALHVFQSLEDSARPARVEILVMENEGLMQALREMKLRLEESSYGIALENQT
jgi:hypothetical protein